MTTCPDVRAPGEAACAPPDSEFTTCTCDYCGVEMRFRRDQDGRNAECPNCGKVIRLGAARIKPIMLADTALAKRVRITTRSRLRRFAQLAGLALFPGGVFALISLVFTPVFDAEPVMRGLFLLLDIGLAGFGLVLMIEGKRTHTHWTCSLCNSHLHAWNDITCQACGSVLG